MISVFTAINTVFSPESVGSILHFSKIRGFRGTHGTHANYALGVRFLNNFSTEYWISIHVGQSLCDSYLS